MRGGLKWAIFLIQISRHTQNKATFRMAFRFLPVGRGAYLQFFLLTICVIKYYLRFELIQEFIFL